MLHKNVTDVDDVSSFISLTAYFTETSDQSKPRVEAGTTGIVCKPTQLNATGIQLPPKDPPKTSISLCIQFGHHNCCY